jgi:hypothetical protein
MDHFTWTKKHIILGTKKVKISLQSPRSDFGLQNQYDRETYPSIRNFTWSKKSILLEVKNGETKPVEPKNGAYGHFGYIRLF